MPTISYDHIHLRSPDPEAAAAFYQRLFGATLERKTINGVARIDMQVCGTRIFISPAAAGDHPPTQAPRQGIDHFGFRVTGGLDALVAEFKTKGASFAKEPAELVPGVRICFLNAPDGVLIELLERA